MPIILRNMAIIIFPYLLMPGNVQSKKIIQNVMFISLKYNSWALKRDGY